MPRHRRRDAMWASLHAKLAAIPGIWKSDAERLRRFVEAVVHVLRTGVAWQDLPERFGKPHSLHRRFRRWSRQGIWDELFERGIPEDGLETVMVDATITKAQRFARGARGGGAEDLGRPVARRLDDQDPRPGRPLRPTLVLSADAGPGGGLPSCRDPARRGGVRLPDRRARLRHRRHPVGQHRCPTVRRAPGRGGDPVQAQPQGADPARSRSVANEAPDREPLRSSQGRHPDRLAQGQDLTQLRRVRQPRLRPDQHPTLSVDPRSFPCERWVRRSR